MGWETVAMVGFQALSARGTMAAGNANAKAIARQGEYDAQNTADNTVRAAGKIQTSFLQSGLTLAGGPMEVLTQAFAKGRTDISRIEANANAGSKNTVNAERSKAIEGFARSAAGSSIMSGVGDFANDFGTGFSEGYNNPMFTSMGMTPGVNPNAPYGPWQNIPLPWAGS